MDALRNSTGMASKVVHSKRGDVSIALAVAGKSLDYIGTLKPRIDRFQMLNDLKAQSSYNGATLLICHALTEAMASRCRELDIQFVDSAGNAYITDGGGVLVYVAGRKAKGGAFLPAPEATITPAAIRMMFGFLADPSLMNAPYAKIAVSVQVSTGSIATVFETLQTRGLIGTTPSGKRLIVSPEQFLSEWAIGYTSRLRPKLKKFRFSEANPGALGRQWSPGAREDASAWGGEVAAEIHTMHLNPATYTIYMDMEEDSSLLAELVKEYRLRADPHGPIEVVQPFWNMDYFNDSFPTVPLHLIYADLLGTQDPRNISVAKQIAQAVIKHVHDTVQ